MNGFWLALRRIPVIIAILLPFAMGILTYCLPQAWKRKRSKSAPHYEARVKVIKKDTIRHTDADGDSRSQDITVFEILATGDKITTTDRKIQRDTNVGDIGIFKMKGEYVEEVVITYPIEKSFILKRSRR